MRGEEGDELKAEEREIAEKMTDLLVQLRDMGANIIELKSEPGALQKLEARSELSQISDLVRRLQENGVNVNIATDASPLDRIKESSALARATLDGVFAARGVEFEAWVAWTLRF